MKQNKYTGFEVAIIGISCRFPGANNWRTFWENLMDEKEAFNKLTDEELLDKGIDKRLVNDENYVKVAPDITNKNYFDASFFNYTPEEGLILGPQNRVFHECVWEAFEDAGYVPEEIPGLVGLYGSASDDMNWKVFAKLSNLEQKVPDFILKHLSNKDFLPTMVSYKLNLSGPSVNMTTACSSSLVGIHTACRALIFGEVNVAAVGGISVGTDPLGGYLYEEGSIYSKDGHCKAFDKDSTGTLAGEGAGVVILKRLSDAIKDNDNIYSIIKGTAVNNDGGRKVGFTAPSLLGQVDCIKTAQRISKVNPDSINYIEAHGTATKLGDSIEIGALNKVFSNVSESIPVGSVKTNIGHLDTAAGVAALIKTALSLKYKKLPASLHFKEANPAINFNEGPFYVNSKTQDFTSKDDSPLRAGISSFGVGGTNAHAILEEPPIIANNQKEEEVKLITLSAQNPTSFKDYKEKIENFIKENVDVSLSDIAYTLQVGRKDFDHREYLVFESREELLDLLKTDTKKVRTKEKIETLFMFSGQGTQYVNMGKDLYESNTTYKEILDRGFKTLSDCSGIDFKNILFTAENSDYDINETRYAQPLIFMLEYAMAKVLIELGVEPKAMIGHSLGEYTAATISGVFSFEDALQLLYKRGELMYNLPKGSMISVLSPLSELEPFINDWVNLAVINSENQVVLSGDCEELDKVTAKLEASGIIFIQLKTSHAFHSYMLDPILDAFKEEFDRINVKKPSIPFISNLTGDYISVDQAISSDYWVRHMRSTVLFDKGLKRLLEDFREECFIEIGPGHVLTSLYNKNEGNTSKNKAVNLVRSKNNSVNDHKFLLQQIGELWTRGVAINWEKVYRTKRSKISLPTYAFKKDEYISEVNLQEQIMNKISASTTKNDDINEWIYRPYWKPSFWIEEDITGLTSENIIFFAEQNEVSKIVMAELTKVNAQVISIFRGDRYIDHGNNSYDINPGEVSDYKKVFEAIVENDVKFSKIYHTWTYTSVSDQHQLKSEQNYRKKGYESIVNILQHGYKLFDTDECEFITISNYLYPLTPNTKIISQKSTVLGAIRVAPVELDNIRCKTIDVSGFESENMTALIKELSYNGLETEVGIRNGERYTMDLEKVVLDFVSDKSKLVKGGVYFISGASGGVGKLLANYLSVNYHANLILLSRSYDEDYVNSLKKNSKILYLQCDISDEENLKLGIEKGLAEFGNINGVIHTAGIADTAGIILRRSIEEEQPIFNSKVSGCIGLYNAFRNETLDFFLNFSSQNVVLPNIGQSGYVASNIFLDHFSQEKHKTFPMISVAWDTIKGIGMALSYLESLDENLRVETEVNALDADEVIELFERVLYVNIPNQIISSSDISQKIKNIKELETLHTESIFDSVSNVDSNIMEERPVMKSKYVAPSSEMEEKIVVLFENFFGITPIGIDDDIFELGADSIKIMTLVNRFLSDLKIKLPIDTFYSYSSARLLSEEIIAINSLEIKEVEETEQENFEEKEIII